jgi:ribA/ribD-fused uncharacterized protein
MINSFSGEYRFLSNFYPSLLVFHDREYATVEHAFQAFKMTTTDNHDFVRRCSSPGIAKRRARELPRREDWELVKDGIMYSCLVEKFTKHYDLQDKLIATRGQVLIEGNTWGDVYWGVSKGTGKNRLGDLLMRVREELINASRS